MTGPRLDYYALTPKTSLALIQLSSTAGGTLSNRLKELVNLRISQVNACAFCVDMHWADLVKQGIEPRLINAICGWREAPRFFSEAERAAFNWAEAVNAIPHRIPDNEDFNWVQQHFTDDQIADLTFTVGAIRAWNMLNASFRMQIPETPYAAR